MIRHTDAQCVTEASAAVHHHVFILLIYTNTVYKLNLKACGEVLTLVFAQELIVIVPLAEHFFFYCLIKISQEPQCL